ncbi:unnamed protein product [Discosporangium mesarthrocarpum]
MWRLLLRYLPMDLTLWAEHLAAKRGLYKRFIEELILKPAEQVAGEGITPKKFVTDPCGDDARRAMNEENEGNGRKGVGSETGGFSGAWVREDRVGGIEPGILGGMNKGLSVEAVLSPRGNSSSCPGTSSGGEASGKERGIRSLCAADSTAYTTCSPAEMGTEGRSTVAPLSRGTGVTPAGMALAVVAEPDLTYDPGAGTWPCSPDNAAAAAPGLGRDGACRRRRLKPAADDPLRDCPSSGWAALKSDKDLMLEIEKDVVRTLPDLQFFAEGGGAGQGRHRALARVLFIYAKLNPGVRYVQGMNEIVGTVYFVLAGDEAREWSAHAEADTFFCFTNLLEEMRDLYIENLDGSENGLHGRVENFSRTLRRHDPELASHLEGLDLDPRYYTLRWFTTLLCREFDLPNTIRLWDSLFSEAEERSRFLVFVFVSLLLQQRCSLLRGDFASNLKLLQDYPPTDMTRLLAQSRALRMYSAHFEDTVGEEDMGKRWMTERAEARAREAAESAKAAAEQVNAVMRRLWVTAGELTSGAAEMSNQFMANSRRNRLAWEGNNR